MLHNLRSGTVLARFKKVSTLLVVAGAITVGYMSAALIRQSNVTEFVYREGSSFDFSNAPTYRKTYKLGKSQVETSATRQVVVSIINGFEETRNTAEPGDKIITAGQGVRYVIRGAGFGDLYEEDPSDPSLYISKNIVFAIQLSENTEITAPWGEKQRAYKGGFVVQRVANPNDVYLIEESAFKATYSLETSARPTAPTLPSPSLSP